MPYRKGGQGGGSSDVVVMLGEALPATLSAIASYLARFDAEGPAAEAAGVPAVSVAAKLDALIAALDSDDPERIEPVLAALGADLPADRLEALRQRLAEFDFRAAEHLAASLRDGYAE